MTGDQTLAVVSNLLSDLLDRPAEPAEVQRLADDHGAQPDYLGLVQSVTRTDEFVRKQVMDALLFCGCEPDSREVDELAERVHAGQVDVDALPVALLDLELADEWSGSGGPAIARVYDVILDRPLSVSEGTFWRKVLRSRGPSSVLQGIWNSTESAAIRLAEHYWTLLKRAPDPGGLNTSTPVLLASGDNAVRASIIASPEYAALAQG